MKNDMDTRASLELLHRLGRGERIADLYTSLGWSKAQFDDWWRNECSRRAQQTTGSLTSRKLTGVCTIERDHWGIPHIHAEDEGALFFALGYATAQDRFFQLDYMRRKAQGRLAEILAKDALESDTLFRTLDLAGIALREWDHLPVDVQHILSSYTDGVNAWLNDAEVLPIEFDLLDYRPEPWKATDSLAILGEFRWYLTGRFPVIVIPELVKQAFGDTRLYHEFLQGEMDEESILQVGEYPASRHPSVSHSPLENGPGSNNWVLAGSRTASGKPLVASDPHIPFAAVSIWQEVHLDCPTFRVVGVALAGVPAVMIGRNENVAWGITNNICSQRDLYQEKLDPAHSSGFLYHDSWEPARVREEVIQVRGMQPVRKIIRSSRHGPIVDEVLPIAANGTGPVSLRWLGFEPCGWLTAMLGMNRARNAREFREATRPWIVPTFNLVYADRDGHIGFQSVGRIPVRNVSERGYRHGWDPSHQWEGVIPFEDMPHLIDPPRGYVATANNRVAPDDFAFPLSGTWVVGWRARRCRELIESRPSLSAEDCKAFQLDCFSLRAQSGVRPLIDAIESMNDVRVQQAKEYLRRWDFRVTTESVAASLFNVFFSRWTRTICQERFAPQSADFIAGNAAGIAGRLLHGDEIGWFTQTERMQAIQQTFLDALDELTERIGPDMDGWAWGQIHLLQQKHFLSGRGDLGVLLDRSGLPCDGDASCINNGQYDAQFQSVLGAGYRMVADLADPEAGIYAVEVAGASGQPGSTHYDDQIEPWSEGKYHVLRLGGTHEVVSKLVLSPLSVTENSTPE